MPSPAWGTTEAAEVDAAFERETALGQCQAGDDSLAAVVVVGRSLEPR